MERPRPPDAANNNIVPALPQPLPLRSTDSGDDYEKAPPRRFSLSPRRANKTAVTQTPIADLSQAAPPSQTNRRTGKEWARKMLKNQVHRRINTRQDEEIVSTEDYVDLAKIEDDVASPMRPGAVAVGGIENRSGRIGDAVLGDSLFVTDPGTPVEPQIVAFLAPHDDDQEIVEARIAQKAEELLRRQMEEGEVVVADEVKDDDASTCCGLKKRTMLLLGILSLLVAIGGVVGGVLAARPTPAAKSGSDPLLDELLLLNATSEKDLWRFEDPESPQYQALEWIKNDTIVMSSDRSTRDLLQRYVLAVLFYSANGPNWGWSPPYLSSDDVCSWNNGTDDKECTVGWTVNPSMSLNCLMPQS